MNLLWCRNLLGSLWPVINWSLSSFLSSRTLGSLWSYLRLLLENFRLSCKVTISWSVSHCIPWQLILVWWASIRHRDVLLSWLVSSCWRILGHNLAARVCKTISMWIHGLALHGILVNWVIHLLTGRSKYVSLWWKHRLMAVLVLVRINATVVNFWVVKGALLMMSRVSGWRLNFRIVNDINWLCLVNVLLLLDLSDSCIKRILSVTLHVFMNLSLCRVRLMLDISGPVFLFYYVVLPPFRVSGALISKLDCLTSRFLLVSFKRCLSYTSSPVRTWSFSAQTSIRVSTSTSGCASGSCCNSTFLFSLKLSLT